MQNIIVTERNDGSIRIEWRMQTDYLSSPNPFSLGDFGCLCIADIDDRLCAAYLVHHPDGVQGNSGTERRLHGWRGTTNSYREYARGWRNVLKIGLCRNDKWWCAVLSEDLRPYEA